MSNRNDLIPWIRYDSKGILIPGTLVYRKKKPAGRFRRLVDPAEPTCCIPTTSTTTAVVGCISLGYWGEYTDSPNTESVDLEGVNVVVDDNCNVYRLSKPNLDGPGINYPFGNYTLRDFALVEKLDGSGNLLWQKIVFQTDVGQTEGFSFFVRPQNISLGVDGSIYITGQYSIIKLDNNGNFLWFKDTESYTGPGNYAENVQVLTPNTGRVYYIVQLAYFGYNPPNPDFPQMVIEIDPATGNQIAGKVFYVPITPGVFDTYSTYVGYASTVDNAGNLICSINAASTVAPDYPTYGGVMKLDPNLNQLWSVMFNPAPGGPTFEGDIMGIDVDANNNIFCVFANDSSITKLDANGNLLWSRYVTYNTGQGSAPANLLNVNVDSAGNAYVLTRNTTIAASGTAPVINVLKFDPTGNMQFLESYWYGNTGSYLWTPFYCSLTSDLKNDVLYVNTTNNTYGTDNNLLKLQLTSTGTLSINSYNFDTSTIFTAVDPNHIASPYTYSEYTAPSVDPIPYQTLVQNAGFTTVTTPIVI